MNMFGAKVVPLNSPGIKLFVLLLLLVQPVYTNIIKLHNKYHFYELTTSQVSQTGTQVKISTLRLQCTVRN